MSGSFNSDNPTGRPMPRPTLAAADPYDGPGTAPPLHTDTITQSGLDVPERDMFAPSRTSRGQEGRNAGPVVPPGSVTGRSLTLVISIMCFLACLTAGTVYMINQSADAWLRDVASEVTVQVEPRDGVDTERTLRELVAHLEQQPGIENAAPLSLDAATSLLEPWLGSSDALKSLPVPRLVSVTLKRDAPPDFSTLASDLKTRFPGATLDDHRQWQRQIQTVTRSLALGGVAILLLVAAATTAIIVSATRSAMASNREIVEVLHFVGATDGFIAREFEKHFLTLGIRAGVVGAGSAMAVFFVMPVVTLLLGGGSMTMVELNRLIGTGTLDAAGYVLLGIVVVVVAALCMLTSRFGVYGILKGGRD
ncbi:MAG: ABC transporter permease [Hyphomicrobiaceae bacterium]|nr:ABC transporter permease [Hyphomicrobiaceae bacterium]